LPGFLWRFFVYFFVFACALADTPEAVRRKSYPEAMRIADIAAAAPPALHSLALRTIASDPRIHDVAWRIDLFRQSEEYGALAVDVSPVVPVPAAEGPLPRIPADSFAHLR
jgi:hypothetical protein